MKKIILFFILLFSINIYSQEIKNDSINIIEAERIADKYIDKIGEAFNEGAKKVVPVAEEAWQLAVNFQRAKAISQFLWPILAIISTILFFKSFKIIYKIEDSKEFSSGDFGFDVQIAICVIAAIGGVITIIGSIITLPETIQMLIAPEWFAVKDIISMF